MASRRILSAAAALPAMALCALVFAGCEDEEAPAALPADLIYVSHDFGANDPDLYVAFGDSITWGSQPDCAPSYPERLSGLLGGTVLNEGIRGQQSIDGLNRVDAVLAQYRPGYLLIIYGANDVFHEIPRRQTITNIFQIAQSAKDNGTIPVLATTLPILVEGHDEWTRAVRALNGEIRQLAAREGVLLVDLEAVVEADPDVLLRSDRVHPSSEGNAAIAQAFYDVLNRIVVETP